jgi:hypothetical protein
VPSTPDDAQLIRSSLIDPQAFAGIFDRHASDLLAYLTRRVGRTDGDTLLGELFRIAPADLPLSDRACRRELCRLVLDFARW